MSLDDWLGIARPTIIINSLLIRNADVHSRERRHGDCNLVCPCFKRETEVDVEIIPFKFK